MRGRSLHWCAGPAAPDPRRSWTLSGWTFAAGRAQFPRPRVVDHVSRAAASCATSWIVPRCTPVLDPAEGARRTGAADKAPLRHGARRRHGMHAILDVLRVTEVAPGPSGPRPSALLVRIVQMHTRSLPAAEGLSAFYSFRNESISQQRACVIALSFTRPNAIFRLEKCALLRGVTQCSADQTAIVGDHAPQWQRCCWWRPLVLARVFQSSVLARDDSSA